MMPSRHYCSALSRCRGTFTHEKWIGPPLGYEAAPKMGPPHSSTRYRLTTLGRTYWGRSILSSTRFAVISATMMLFDIPKSA